MKTTIIRLSYMLSVYQLILTACIVLIPSVPIYISEYVRAMSVFIPIGWTLLYLYGKNNAILNMYYSLYSPYIPDIAFQIIDFVAHILPLVVLGLPVNSSSYIFAGAFLMIWYSIVVRPRAQFIYGNILTKKESDNAFYIIVPVVTAILFMVHHLQGARK